MTLIRNVNGIVLLDKPLGLSSNDLLQRVKHLFHAKKAGHTGTLDPIATGMLPICFGEATKFSQYLISTDKRYQVTARLGERTDTSDANGKKISIRPVLLNKTQLEVALNSFRGKSNQVPPMFSALKYKGRPLYEYARKGIILKRKARPIFVYNLYLRYWNFKEIKLEIHCSKGTYIRIIIDDLGEYLGCGAHITALRRISVGDYPAERMVTLSTLQNIVANKNKEPKTFNQLDKLLLPIDSALSMPVINLQSNIAYRIKLGQSVMINTNIKSGLVRLTEGKSNYFFGIGKITTSGFLIPIRLMAKLIN